MPAKYSHVKKRAATSSASPSKKTSAPNPLGTNATHLKANPHADRGITKALSVVAELERVIAKILLIRYEQDIARLFSTRLYTTALIHLPTFVMRCVTLAGPGWVAYNAECDEVKDWFRLVIAMDMRQAGERVATKSVLWSYTALRHFALSNSITVCEKRGLHSLRLLPHLPAIKDHLAELEALPVPTFNKPPTLGSLQEGLTALEEACQAKAKSNSHSQEWEDWRTKVKVGYERLSQTLWKVAREFDPRGYGLILREKLTDKWCDCGCSTDHLGEVCERTVREDEEANGIYHPGCGGEGALNGGKGKGREWDGRGSGVYGWGTEDEEDIWEQDMDFGGLGPEEGEEPEYDPTLTVGEMVELRFVKAEKEKEMGNSAFRRGDYSTAISHYEKAHKIEPELPTYQLNLAAAYLKLCNWMEAEKACTKALGQHRSGKGYYRRAKARKMMGRYEEAMRDLRAILKMQPGNMEARTELLTFSSLPSSATQSSPSKAKKSKPKTETTASNAENASSSQAPPSPSPSNVPDSDLPNEIPEPPGLQLPKIKPPKPPPFPRMPSDDRKLKISIVPTSFSASFVKRGFGSWNNKEGDKENKDGIDVKITFKEGGKQGSKTKEVEREKPPKDTKGKAKEKQAPRLYHSISSSSTDKDKDKGKASLQARTIKAVQEALERELRKAYDGSGKSESVSYPGWEKYVIKRVD